MIATVAVLIYIVVRLERRYVRKINMLQDRYIVIRVGTQRELKLR